MAQKIRKIGVLTSGGDSPGMNAAVRAVVRTCAYHKIDCVGIYRGYEGLIDGDFEPMDARSVRDIINRGGTMLKSARSDRFRTPEGRKIAYDNLVENKIDGLVLIGGDGTFTGGLIFNREYNFPVMGIPGTIDNDISGTDKTLGYDTALNTAVEAIDKIRDTASSHNRLFFVEVMGRDVGHIALNAGVGAGAEEILIPEENLGLDRLLELKDYVDENLDGYDVRVAVLGHMQRGGSPSCYDRVLASRMGVKAVESLLEGESNYMVGIQHEKMELYPIEKAIKGKSHINKELVRVSEIMTT